MTASFFYIPFLGGVRGPCPTQCGRECLSAGTVLAQIVGANLSSSEAVQKNLVTPVEGGLGLSLTLGWDSVLVWKIQSCELGLITAIPLLVFSKFLTE